MELGNAEMKNGASKTRVAEYLVVRSLYEGLMEYLVVRSLYDGEAGGSI